MLVLSRRAKQRVSFPSLGVTVHFLRVSAGTVKVGIAAPPEVQIIRDEIDEEASAAAVAKRLEQLRLPRELRHTIRNELNTISIGMELYRRQMLDGLHEAAEETWQTLQETFHRLDENDLLNNNTENAPVVSSIMIVDDDANEREMLASFLRLKGFEVSTASDGDHALRHLEIHGPPSLILMDMNMPNRDGATTVRDIRNDPRYPDVRIYAVSGTSPEDNGLDIGVDGVDRWFTKPLNLQAMVNTILCESSMTMT